MPGKFAKYNIKKMEGLHFDIDLDEIAETCSNYSEMLTELDSIKAQDVNDAAKNHIIIKLVSLIEDSFKKIVKDQVDLWEGNMGELFQSNKILISISDLDSIKNSEFTKGALVASNFNFQNPFVIDSTMSKILNLDFFETLKSLCNMTADSELIPKIDAEKKEAELFLKARTDLVNHWGDFLQLFKFRISIAHNSGPDIYTSNNQIEWFIADTYWFLFYGYLLAHTVGLIRTNQINEVDYIEDAFTVKFSRIKKLITDKSDKYLSYDLKKNYK